MEAVELQHDVTTKASCANIRMSISVNLSGVVTLNIKIGTYICI